MSHDSAISRPPASAGPSTAAMIGLRRSRVTMPANPPLGAIISPARPALISLRSAPAQKNSFVPVRMPTHRSSDSSRRSMPASMPWATSALTALRASGRLIFMTRTLPMTSSSTMAAP